MTVRLATWIAVFLGLTATPAFAAGAGPNPLGELPLLWVIPFAGILLSIALLPLVAPHFWHHHYGKVAAFWALAFIVPCFVKFGASTTLHELGHVYLLEYVPFIILLGGLFVVAGGILVKGSFRGTPATNAAMLGVGTLLASLIGTTGASMLLIRPVLRANKERKSRAHTVVFFIFLVSNVGGSLTPLGDPPLFLGFLKGVPFFWTLSHIWMDTAVVAAVLFAAYFVMDSVLYKRDGRPFDGKPPGGEPFGLAGKINLLFLLGIVGAVFASGKMQEAQEAHIARTGDAHYQMFHLGVAHVGLPQLVRDGAIVLFALLSLKLTPKATRAANEFSWGPILEVAKLFAGIFACMLPAIAILKAGEHGALAGLVKSVTHPHHYFWATGGLSSFLDNAPTYLVFFETAQATPMDAFAARGAWGAVDPVSDKINMPSAILAAISAGAVFMGANSYIGNGPNFMVKAIADSDGVPMPSFFGYVFKWAVPFLIPCFILLTFLFFMPA